MQVRQSIHSDHAKHLDTEGLRREFLIENMFVADQYTMTYSHSDRIIVGGIQPVTQAVTIGDEVGKQLGVCYFLERRELGVINIGGPGMVAVDGTRYGIGHEEALYVGQGARNIRFESMLILERFALQGKVAVITGCDTGLGQGMPIGLVEAGCDIVGVNIVEPDETLRQVETRGRRFLSIKADLSDTAVIPGVTLRRWQPLAIAIFWSTMPALFAARMPSNSAKKIGTM